VGYVWRAMMGRVRGRGNVHRPLNPEAGQPYGKAIKCLIPNCLIPNCLIPNCLIPNCLIPNCLIPKCTIPRVPAGKALDSPSAHAPPRPRPYRC
jgi:hypothetical protein